MIDQIDINQHDPEKLPIIDFSTASKHRIELLRRYSGCTPFRITPELITARRSDSVWVVSIGCINQVAVWMQGELETRRRLVLARMVEDHPADRIPAWKANRVHGDFNFDDIENFLRHTEPMTGPYPYYDASDRRVKLTDSFPGVWVVLDRLIYPEWAWAKTAEDRLVIV